jgi:hypothetical protein
MSAVGLSSLLCAWWETGRCLQDLLQKGATSLSPHKQLGPPGEEPVPGAGPIGREELGQARDAGEDQEEEEHRAACMMQKGHLGEGQ